MPGLASFLIEDDGSVTDKTIEHYRKRAAGGPAMVIVEAHAVAPEAIVSPHQARIYDDRFTEGISRIARVIKSEGVIPALQIHHGGRQVPFRVIKQKPYAPSPLPCPTIRGDVEPLTHEGIQRIIHAFGDCAERVVDAGFELLEIHGAHGYLINSFLSRFSNIREDEYGGDLTGRSRFALEIIKEVRKRVGDAFPLSFKISAQEFVSGGLTTEESIEILKILVPAGMKFEVAPEVSHNFLCLPVEQLRIAETSDQNHLQKFLAFLATGAPDPWVERPCSANKGLYLRQCGIRAALFAGYNDLSFQQYAHHVWRQHLRRQRDNWAVSSCQFGLNEFEA